MFSSLSLALLVLFLTGTAVVIALALRAGRNERTGGSIAQVLYNVENPENKR